MERYFKRKASCAAEDEINWDEEIQYDPGLRKEIDFYHNWRMDLVNLAE